MVPCAALPFRRRAVRPARKRRKAQHRRPLRRLFLKWRSRLRKDDGRRIGTAFRSSRNGTVGGRRKTDGRGPFGTTGCRCSGIPDGFKRTGGTAGPERSAENCAGRCSNTGKIGRKRGGRRLVHFSGQSDGGSGRRHVLPRYDGRCGAAGPCGHHAHAGPVPDRACVRQQPDRAVCHSRHGPVDQPGQ